MSYEFSLLFKQVENEAEAFEFARNITQIAYFNAYDIIKMQLWKRPSEHYRDASMQTDLFWVQSLFNFRFVYWKKEKLLGLFDTGYPDVVVNCFDCNQFFQNATDQNYDFDSWSDKIDLFKKTKSICLNLSKEGLSEAWMSCGYETDDECDVFSDEYKLQVLMYKYIYRDLCLDSWEDDCASDVFFKFAMSSITSGQKSSALKNMFRIALKNEKGENELC